MRGKKAAMSTIKAQEGKQSGVREGIRVFEREGRGIPNQAAAAAGARRGGSVH